MNNISTIINNKEFDERISEASEYQIKIIDELKPQLKELKGRFIQLLIEIDFNSIKSVYEIVKKKKNKADSEVKQKYKDFLKKANKIFKACINVLINEELAKTQSINNIYVAGEMLRAIGYNYIVARYSNFDFKKIQEIENDKKANEIISYIINEAVKTELEIRKNTEMIKIDIFCNLPDEVRYDKDDNPNGIKGNNFQKLVRHKAIGCISDTKKFTKYISNQIDKDNQNLNRGEIVLEKTKCM